MKKNSFAEILSDIDRKAHKKLVEKIPSLEGIRIPTGPALEQCSSEATARHKARLAAGLASGKCLQKDSCKVADLTGGLGIDCWAFSRVFGRVLHNEINPVLSDAVRENFESLGIGNVSFSCLDIRPDSNEWRKLLESFKPDILYLDPARRDASGKKVFLIEDCSPNVLELLPLLLSISPLLLLKLSPMADISLIASRLSDRCRRATDRTCLKHIQAVGFGGECKELLCVIDRDWDGPSSISAIMLGRNGDITAEWSTPPDMQDGFSCRIAEENELEAGRILLNPEAVLLKTGLQDLICRSVHVSKLERFTQLYICNGEIPDSAAGMFSCYRIIEVLPFCNLSFKDLGRRYPCMDVTAKNLPVSSEELRNRIFGKKATASRPDLHVWGFSTPYGRFLAVCIRM